MFDSRWPLVFGLPKFFDEMDPHDQQSLLLYAAMYEEIEWTAIRHSNDLHATVTEDDVKQDAFISAASWMASKCAEALVHSAAILREGGEPSRSLLLHRGEAFGQAHLAHEVLRAAYESLLEHGLIERHSKLWDRIPVTERTPDWMKSYLNGSSPGLDLRREITQRRTST